MRRQRYSAHRMIFGWVVWDNQTDAHVESCASRMEARGKCVELNSHEQRTTSVMKRRRNALRELAKR